MKKRMLLLAPLVLLLLLVVTFLSLRAYFTEERILALLEPKLETALGQPVQIAGAALQAFPLAVAMHGIALHENPAAQNAGEAMISVGSIRCDVDTSQLLRRNLVIRSLVLDSLRVHLRQRPDSTWNVVPIAKPNADATATAAPREAAPLALTIRSLALRHALLDVQLPDRDIGVVIPLEATLQFTADRQMQQLSLQGDIECVGIHGTQGVLENLRDLNVRLQPRLQIDIPDSSAQIEELKVQLQDLEVALFGNVRMQEGRAHGEIHTKSQKLQLADLLSLVPTALAPQLAEFTAQGLVDMDLEIALRGEATPAVHGELHLTEGMLQSPELPEAIRAIQADVLWKDDRLELQKLQAEFQEQPILVQGFIQDPLQPQQTAVDLRIDGSLSLQAASAFATLPPETSMQGTLIAALQARGRVQDSDNLQISGTLALQDAVFTSPQANYPIHVSGKATVQEKRLQIERTVVRIGKTTAELTGEVAPLQPGVLPRIDLRGRANHMDLDDLLPTPSAAASPGAAQQQGPATAAAPTLLPPNMLTDIDVTFDVDSAQYQQAQWKRIHLQAAATPAGFRLAAKVDSLNRDALHMHALQLQLQGDSLNASGTITAQNTTLGRVQVRQLRSRLEVAGTQVQLPDMTASLYNGTLKGQSTFDLSDANAPQYDMSLEMQAVEAGLLFADVLPGGQWMSGKLQGTSRWSSSGADPGTLRSNLTALGSAQATGGILHRFPLVDAFTKALRLDSVRDIRYEDLGLNFQVAEGRVEIPELKLQAKEFTIETLGAIDLNGKVGLDAHVILSEAQSKQYLRGDLGNAIQQLFADPQGRVVLDFNVDGTVKAPRLRPDLEATAARGGLQALDANSLGRLLGDVLPKTDDSGIGGALRRGLGGLFGSKDDKKAAAADSTRKP